MRATKAASPLTIMPQASVVVGTAHTSAASDCSAPMVSLQAAEGGAAASGGRPGGSRQMLGLKRLPAIVLIPLQAGDVSPDEQRSTEVTATGFRHRAVAVCLAVSGIGQRSFTGDGDDAAIDRKAASRPLASRRQPAGVRLAAIGISSHRTCGVDAMAPLSSVIPEAGKCEAHDLSADLPSLRLCTASLPASAPRLTSVTSGPASTSDGRYSGQPHAV